MKTPYALKNYPGASNERVFLFDPLKLEQFLRDGALVEEALPMFKFSCFEEYNASMYDREMSQLRLFQMALGTDLPEAIIALLFRNAPSAFAFELLQWIFPDADISMCNGERKVENTRGYHSVRTYKFGIKERGGARATSESFFYSVAIVRAIATVLLDMEKLGQLYERRQRYHFERSPRGAQLSLNIEANNGG